MDELKPCECGGSVLLYQGRAKCLTCGKTTKSYRTDERAVEGWNGNWTYYDK